MCRFALDDMHLYKSACTETHDETSGVRPIEKERERETEIEVRWGGRREREGERGDARNPK